MKKLLILLVACLPLVAMAQKKDKDWADYGRYEKANASLTKAPSVVFMGNSITQCWYEMHPDFFNDNNFAGRGISGQTSSEMLVQGVYIVPRKVTTTNSQTFNLKIWSDKKSVTQN